MDSISEAVHLKHSWYKTMYVEPRKSKKWLQYKVRFETQPVEDYQPEEENLFGVIPDREIKQEVTPEG